MEKKVSVLRNYISLVLLFVPPVLFALLICIFPDTLKRGSPAFRFWGMPWQFMVVLASGIAATIGGVLDWRFHRLVLKMKMSEKERKAEAAAMGLGGVPMFLLMAWATCLTNPRPLLIPIILVLIYTVVAISYDEFVFHRKRCGKLENRYHRMLVLGNGLAWMAWFHYIFYT